MESSLKKIGQFIRASGSMTSRYQIRRTLLLHLKRRRNRLPSEQSSKSSPNLKPCQKCSTNRSSQFRDNIESLRVTYLLQTVLSPVLARVTAFLQRVRFQATCGLVNAAVGTEDLYDSS